MKKLSIIRQKLWDNIRKRPVLSGVIGFVFLIGLVGLTRGGDDSDAPSYHTVSRGDFLVSIVEGGTLEAVNQVVVRNEVDESSRIIYIVPEGSFVSEGDLIVELDSAEAQEELNQELIQTETSRAEFIAAQNEMIIMQSTVDSEVRAAELAVVFGRMDLEKFEEIERAQDLRNAEIEIITAKEELQLAQEKLQWSERLTEKGFETKSNLDRDRLTVTNQSLTLEKAESLQEMLQSYDLAKKYEEYRSILEEAEQELIRVKKQGESNLAKAEADLRSAERTLQLNQDRLKLREQQFTATKIYAPQDGLIVYAIGDSRWSSESLIEEGATVRRRQELIRIPDTSQMKVVIKVHESHIGQVQKGQLSFVVLDSLPDQRFKGRVEKVAILPDAQSRWGNPNLKVYSTEIVITDPLPDVKPGVSARAEIIITRLEDVISVPLQAVTSLGPQQVCYIKSGNEAKPVQVEVGLFNNQLIEIKSGLSEGDEILLAPPLNSSADLGGAVVDKDDDFEVPDIPVRESTIVPGGGGDGEPVTQRVPDAGTEGNVERQGDSDSQRPPRGRRGGEGGEGGEPREAPSARAEVKETSPETTQAEVPEVEAAPVES